MTGIKAVLTPSSLLLRPVGAPGSGAARYAIAMSCYMQGQISAELLEIYRRCSKFDKEDPIALAHLEGINLPCALRGPASGSS